MAEQISFIHAADLHLDSPFKGLAHITEHIFKKVRNSTFSALDRLVKTAIDNKVDFVLIVGDLFDNEKQSLKAQVHLRKAFEQLQHHDINVYLSYGNHDFINGNIHPVTYPDNVFIFPNEKVTHFTFKKDNEICAAIYGFSYENRSVLSKKAQEYQLLPGKIPFHIGMLHGSLHSNTDHDVYAPFYLSDLTEKNFDYWALGHIHQREVLKEHPSIVYPGNIQGRNRKETGDKGCYHVVLSKTDTAMTFIPLQSLQYNSLTIDVSDCDELHQLETKIQSEVSEYTKDSGPQLLQLLFKSNQDNLQKWNDEQMLDEVIELVNETILHQANWKYIFRYQVERLYSIDNELAQGEHFVGELIRHFDEVSIQSYLKELYQHKQARKYMEPITGEDELRIKHQAKHMLVHELLKNGGD
ncbi:DNA repair exonuclease SbcCD nuclease subunit [Virgibacillus subterraneus]|uniref:DNA repair exonuclease SbcCD nuclease subunit n=1 Tax=Virgibacillus subterraneus TaxID=621109 RepID=A0A1H9FU07_9BACI|nr:DNA repair exonuclease SbcCD nuclease subunit [Virgibacillus subterraneus]